MGREIRKVPPDWEHPKDEDGEYIPLEDTDIVTAAKEWAEEVELFSQGKHPEQGYYSNFQEFIEDKEGPYWKAYRTRIWTEEEATHYQYYENVTEGTPLSPVLPREELKEYLFKEQGIRYTDKNFDTGLA